MFHRRSIAIPAVLLTLLVRCGATVAAEAHGLVGEYFKLDTSPTSFPDVTGKTPFLVRVDPNINFEHTGGEFYKTHLTDNFYVRWNGTLAAPTTGQYTIFTAVDDVVRVSIDGKVILEDTTTNGMSQKSVKTELTAGPHAVEIEFLQKGGDAGLIVAWQPPAGQKQVIPPAAFTHDPAAEKIKWDKHAWARAGSAGGNDRVSEWEGLDYGPFVSASITQPTGITEKGIVVKLAPVTLNGMPTPVSICFDSQLMRVSGGWTGGFLHFNNVAFTGEHGPTPSVAGAMKFQTSVSPAWAGRDGSFTDPRIALYGEAFGGTPRDYLHYKGLYRHGEEVVFSYTVNGMDVLDLPGDKVAGNEVAFTRTFQIGASTVPQTLILAEVDSATVAQEASKSLVALEGAEAMTAAGLVAPPAGVELLAMPTADKGGQNLCLRIAPHSGEEKLQVAVWSGDKTEISEFKNSLNGDVPDVASLTKGGPAHWPQELDETGKLQVEPTRDADKAAYVLDEIGIPNIPGNWPRLRFGGFDFFPDGHTAALCTWNGDVYIVKGIDEKLDHLSWRRIAGGLFQTLGLKIVNGLIYVNGRDQITILHDLDGDGESDFYENFNNDVAITDHFHEFCFDLQQDAAGNFYIIKGGGVNQGGRGFMTPITRNHGTLMKISPDGSKLEVIATGFRAPNGMCVRDDGQAVTGDNQGSWQPVDRLNWIKPGMFCGVVELSHMNPLPTFTDNPLMWFPYPGWDNSCGDPVFVTSDKWGQPKNDLFYLSYGQTSLLHILPEEVDGQMQGGAVRFPWHFTSGCMRARFNPADGQLYVCGFQGWQTNARRQTAFERVRYTGKKSYLPTALHIKDKGIQISFAEPLKKDSVEDAGAWGIEEWNYRWTSDYGSGEFKVSNPAQPGHDPVDVKSAKLSDDGKTVFLEVPDLQPVMQMLIRGNALEAVDGTPVNVEIANTINVVKGKKLVVEIGKVETK